MIMSVHRLYQINFVSVCVFNKSMHSPGLVPVV